MRSRTRARWRSVANAALTIAVIVLCFLGLSVVIWVVVESIESLS